MLYPRIWRDDDGITWLASNYSEQTAAKVLAAAEGGNDDGGIVIGGVRRRTGQTDWLECPRGDDIDDEACVTPEPG